jgi:hypothetical protein
LCGFVAFGCAQHIGHLVRVVLVHLAAEGLDENFFGHGSAATLVLIQGLYQLKNRLF